MRTPFIKLLFLTTTALFILVQNGNSQSPLDNYISEGLKNNIVLQQKATRLDQALLTLKIANGMFLPSAAIQGNYTSGNGGRNISLPIGDLLNPVYSTLNQLTDSNQFPQVENVNQNFFAV